MALPLFSRSVFAGEREKLRLPAAGPAGGAAGAGEGTRRRIKMQANTKYYGRLMLAAGLASVAVAAVLIALKAAVWFVSGSHAVFASLTDSIFDALTSLVNLFALRYSLQPPDSEHRYGHYKSQTLSSLAQAAFVGGSAVLLILSGVKRFNHPVALEHTGLALAVSLLAMLLTVFLVGFQTLVYRRTRSEAIGADRFHYLSDLTLNLGVLAALILSEAGWPRADGLFAVLIGLYILRGAWIIGSRAADTLLDKSLKPEDLRKIRGAAVGVPGVLSVHDIKTHRVGPMVFIQAHVVLPGGQSVLEAHRVINEVETRLAQLYPLSEITIHMEPDISQTYREVQFKD